MPATNPAAVQLLTALIRDFVQSSREATMSQAVDLEQVAAQLQAISEDHDPLLRESSLGTTPDAETANAEAAHKEAEFYGLLVAEGGRPPYPFHLVESMFWSFEKYLEHEEYRDIILYWRGNTHPTERTPFLAHHLLRWRTFRRLQRIIREHGAKDERTLMDQAAVGSSAARLGLPSPLPKCTGQWAFSDYAENMKARLNKYGFTRSFQLERDLDSQDKMITWIEYLGYEYYFYDNAASSVQRLQRRHDRAWSKLVDTKLLRPEETYDAICNRDVFQYIGERTSAEQAIQLATDAVSSTERAIARSRGSAGELRQRLQADQAALNAAKERLALISARNAAIGEFRKTTADYRLDKDRQAKVSLLIQWILRQIPVIDHELSLDNAGDELDGKRSQLVEGQHTRAEADEHADPARMPATNSPLVASNPNKRGRSSSEHPPSKRSKGEKKDVATASANDRSFGAANMSTGNYSRPDRPLRRSTRLAKKAEAVSVAKVAPTVQDSSVQRGKRPKKAYGRDRTISS